jgi:signal transduction histidine kinase
LLNRAVRQLRKIEITYDHLVLYDKEIAGGLRSNPVVLQLGRVLEQLRRELPDDESSRIAVSGNGRDLYILGDVYQVSFALLALLSFALRFTPGCEQVDVKVESRQRAKRQWVEVSIPATAQPPPPEKFTRRRVDEFVTRVIADVDLGSRIIESFVAGNGGVYQAPKTLTGKFSFQVRFPVADLSS